MRRFAAHRKAAVLTVAVLPVLARLALLPLLPIPQPQVADEFSHLFIADTLAAGRLSNPVHPMWPHFEAIYILQQRVYASIYPIAQGALMGAAKVAGLPPCYAVWLSVGAMCGLICWALQGWTTPAWALIGGLLAITRFSITSYWMNSYWGGAVPAIGGALVFGALPRLIKRRRIRDSAWLGFGFAILAQSRPYEGFLLALPVGFALLLWIFKERRIGPLLPFAAVIAAALGFTAYYNWRITGHPLLLPYQLNQQVYGTPQPFFWHRPIYDAPGIHRAKDVLDNFYWQLGAYQIQFQPAGLMKRVVEKLYVFWTSYLQIPLSLPLLLLPFALRDGRLRQLTGVLTFVLVGIGFYPFFYPHYAAPVFALFLLVLLECMRYVARIRWNGWPAGELLVAAILAITFSGFVVNICRAARNPAVVLRRETPRSQVQARLERSPESHLVLVRYGPEHPFHFGCVYNEADIDKSKVVWARELDPASNQALLSYYSNRKPWLFEPDQFPPKLTPLPQAAVFPPPHISSIVNAAAGSNAGSSGITPGEIVTIFGENFARDVQDWVTLGSMFGPLPLELEIVTPESGNLFVRSFRRPELMEVTPTAQLPFFDENTAPLPTRLVNVSVDFGSVPAAIFSVSNYRGNEAVTVQVPSGLHAAATAVALRFGNSVTTLDNVPLAPTAPAIFQRLMSDHEIRAAALHFDGSLISVERPARRGETIRLLVTGLGEMRQIRVGLNNAGIDALAAGREPSLNGAEFVAFPVPANAPASDDDTVTIAVNVNGKLIFSNSTRIPVH